MSCLKSCVVLRRKFFALAPSLESRRLEGPDPTRSLYSHRNRDESPADDTNFRTSEAVKAFGSYNWSKSLANVHSSRGALID